MTARALFAAVLFLSIAGAHAGLEEDMAAFERMFIPALALTNQPKQPAERVARSLGRLAEAWPRMRTGFTGKGEPLEAAVRATDRALERAGRLLAEDRRAEAHEALEAIRPAFIDARRAGGIDFYVDRLTEFHEAMEELAKAAEGGSAPAELFERASGLWTRAERPGFDAALFAFDEARYAELRKRVQGEREVLDALGAALARGEPAQVRELAAQMKSRFAQIYVMFGNFEGL